MVIRINAPLHSPLSFGVVKQLLLSIGLGPEVPDPRLAQSLRLYFPLDAALATRVRADAVSLTDGATPAEQIRYLQRRRIRRNHIVVAEHVTANHGRVVVEIGCSHAIDEPSREFLEVASSVGGWEIRCLSGRLDVAEIPMDPTEARLVEAMAVASPVAEISRAAWEFVNVGDAWTATTLGRTLLGIEQSPAVFNVLAIANAMLNESERAAFYYTEWESRGNAMDKVRALYGKAMLYARHHPAGLRDLNKAAQCLEEAFEILQGLDANMREDETVVFEEVFNRNGYALVLSRRGDVDGALHLLTAGIERLTATSEKVAIHRSVLLYNLAQCFTQLGRMDEAIGTYEKILRVDPNMAEYHLESAKCLTAVGSHDRALMACRTAIRLDDTLAVSWRMLGSALVKCGQHEEAAEAFLRAVQLETDHSTGRADAAYALLGSARWEDALEVLVPVAVERLSAAEIDRHFSLIAEAHLKAGQVEMAVSQLKRGLRLRPDSHVLHANLAHLAA